MTKERWIPPGTELLMADAALGAVVYCSPPKTGGGAVSAIGYSGKRGRHDFWISFRSEARMLDHVEKWLNGLHGTAERKVKRAADRKSELAAAASAVAVGDIFVSSWGYDQTNVDFYEVVEVKGAYCLARPIAGESESDDCNGMTGFVVPMPKNYTGEAKRYLIQAGPSIKVRSFATARRLDPILTTGGMRIYKAQRWTAYA